MIPFSHPGIRMLQFPAGHLARPEDTHQFVCPVCQQQFRTKQGHSDHVRVVHMAAKLSQCHSCGASFKWRSQLQAHRKHCEEYLLTLTTHNDSLFSLNHAAYAETLSSAKTPDDSPDNYNRTLSQTSSAEKSQDNDTCE